MRKLVLVVTLLLLSTVLLSGCQPNDISKICKAFDDFDGTHGECVSGLMEYAEPGPNSDHAYACMELIDHGATFTMGECVSFLQTNWK